MEKEITEKISRAKTEATRNRIIEGLNKNNISQQSDVKLKIPTHRKKNFISFEEYKNFIKEGKTIEELNQITSKHIVAFYSALSKGRIGLTKENFVNMYEKGMSLDEISKQYNIPREHISFLRDFYGIKRKGAKYQRRLQNEKPLSQEAKDIIVGSLLGDGCINNGGYFSEKHSEKQIEYLEWKASHLANILSDKSFAVYTCIDKRSGTKIYSFCLRTVTHSYLYELRNKFYKKENGKWIKILPPDIEDMINEKILAILFMDDGSTDWMYRNGIRKYLNRPQSKISSQSFTYEENKILQQIILKKFNINSIVKIRNGGLYYLKFNCDDTAKLIKTTKPFSTPDLLYKFDDAEYLKHVDYLKKLTDDKKDKMTKAFKEKHNIN